MAVFASIPDKPLRILHWQHHGVAFLHGSLARLWQPLFPTVVDTESNGLRLQQCGVECSYWNSPWCCNRLHCPGGVCKCCSGRIWQTRGMLLFAIFLFVHRIWIVSCHSQSVRSQVLHQGKSKVVITNTEYTWRPNAMVSRPNRFLDFCLLCCWWLACRAPVFHSSKRSSTPG